MDATDRVTAAALGAAKATAATESAIVVAAARRCPPHPSEVVTSAPVALTLAPTPAPVGDVALALAYRDSGR